MRKWHIEISSPAEDDIDGIYTYIAKTLLEPVTAWHQVERIYDGIFSLNTMPERCPLLQDEPWHSKGLRKLAVDNYLVVYSTDERAGTVHIIAVVYSRRDLTVIDFDL